jgi:hypothetical protein
MRQVGIWKLMGFASTALFGTLLHFLYEWLGKTVWIAPFSGVNESTWEHMKLLFWPMLIFAITECVFASWQKGLPGIKLYGMLIGICLIPIIFYLYNGIIGKSPDWFNIAIFFIAAAAAYIYELYAELSFAVPRISTRSAVLIFCTVALLFVLFTFITPHLEIFKDPTNGSYGIN